MAKMVYDEWYGDLTLALRAAIRKYNVSPSDYRDLTDVYGEGNYSTITNAIEANSPDGMFSTWRMHQALRG